MKRRLVAVTLSLVMTMATVSEAGAATFTSPDGNSVVAVQAETETDTEPVDAQSDPEASSEEDIFQPETRRQMCHLRIRQKMYSQQEVM